MKKKKSIWICQLIAMGFVVLLDTGCRKDGNAFDPEGFRSNTTHDRTIIPNTISPFPPLIYPYEIAKYPQYGYGGWHYGDGIAYQKRLDLMSADYTGAS